MKKIFNVEYYDVNDVAKILGITTETARALFRRRELKGHKIGKAWHATKSEILQYIETNK